MSSKIQFDLSNYTSETLKTKITDEKDIEDSSKLDDLTLYPLEPGSSTHTVNIEVTTGSPVHNDNITVNFHLLNKERIGYAVT